MAGMQPMTHPETHAVVTPVSQRQADALAAIGWVAAPESPPKATKADKPQED